MMDIARDLQQISDYLADRLSDEDHRAFGERLVHEPRLVQELELTLRMREGLHHLQASGYVPVPAQTTGHGRRWLPALAAAAVLAVVALGLQIYTDLRRSTAPAAAWLSASPTAESGTVPFTFIQMRGSSPVLKVPVTGRVEFNVAVESTDRAAVYQVVLFGETGPSGKPLATLSGVAPDTDGFLHLHADASHLQPGQFVLVIQPSDPSVAPETFPFTVTRPSGSPVR